LLGEVFTSLTKKIHFLIFSLSKYLNRIRLCRLKVKLSNNSKYPRERSKNKSFAFISTWDIYIVRTNHSSLLRRTQKYSQFSLNFKVSLLYYSRVPVLDIKTLLLSSLFFSVLSTNLIYSFLI